MQISHPIQKWIIAIFFITLALSFYRFRWGILSLFNIGAPSQACEHMEVLDAYLNTRGDPDAYLGRTPLIMCATERESYTIVSKLIDLGVDVDAQKKFPILPFMNSTTGTTALYVSVLEENFEITKLLFENGADINADTSPDSTAPLNLAVGSDRPQSLKLFLEVFRLLFEADIHFERTYEVALIRAASEGHLQLVKFLYEKGIL